MKSVLAVLAMALVVRLGLGGWFAVERRWQGDLFCIEWSGDLRPKNLAT